MEDCGPGSATRQRWDLRRGANISESQFPDLQNGGTNELMNVLQPSQDSCWIRLNNRKYLKNEFPPEYLVDKYKEQLKRGVPCTYK